MKAGSTLVLPFLLISIGNHQLQDKLTAPGLVQALCDLSGTSERNWDRTAVGWYFLYGSLIENREAPDWRVSSLKPFPPFTPHEDPYCSGEPYPWA
jgi:hypothetical protein